MVNPKLKADLEALQAQVRDISKRLDEQADAADPKGTPSALDEVRRIAEEMHAPELFEHATKFFGGVGRDIQDSKPRALVAAFVAGFIAGKALGR